MRKGSPISVYLDEKALSALDEAVAKRAQADREAGLSGHAVTNRSKLISHIVTEYLLEEDSGKLTIRKIKQTVCPILKKQGVTKALLFGSYARGEQTESSDVDIAIDEGQVRGLAFFSLQNELSDALGKPVDLQSLNAGNAKFLASIARDGVELYVA